ncbi:MAG: class I SAM-dependent methyltransferase [Candidatus Bathyarchaeota archaeon]|nr:class I SAM-dependent methyltransferase [Candidatus Bathyarchaeota archaeon]MDH5494222.1 class I SAM-dependent methyltransferase [Candidatus Bathyarchaeota archaeon]
MNYRPKKVFFGKHVFVVSGEVYEPAEDTFLIAHNLSVSGGEKVLDMGTGCGILAVLAAEKASEVVAVDINPHAVVCAKKNAELNGVGAKVETRLGNLFDAVEADEKFDLVLFNAPYLPVERDEGKSWIEKAWAGEKSGRTVIDRFISKASKFLIENGRILLVQSSLSNVEETLRRFSQCKLHAAIVGEEKLAFEKIVLIEARQ